jgi:hypothetical protein
MEVAPRKAPVRQARTNSRTNPSPDPIEGIEVDGLEISIPLAVTT